MQERSQGCQSFISFLLTVGAEASSKVLINMILLLDEPETHLHPKGVRYMLQELIKIANHGNNVFYATHSIFMIDREKYERHVILTKKNEKTILQPSIKDRIGYFMQEEVLYKALDINLNTDFKTANIFNFVFEGEGDAVLFQKFYSLLIEKDQPFAIGNSSFYHGGKCNDIIDYFSRNPIQLGSKWIFIIDNDDPAIKLRKFLEKKYNSYLNKDVYIFQYNIEGKTGTELEDILPDDYIEKTVHET
jgi:energy-coupling factor transporter ATP-binding protein EcfA2